MVDKIGPNDLYLATRLLLAAVDAAQRNPSSQTLEAVFDGIAELKPMLIAAGGAILATQPVQVGFVSAPSTPVGVFRHARQVLGLAALACSNAATAGDFVSVVSGRKFVAAIFDGHEQEIARCFKHLLPALDVERLASAASIECSKAAEPRLNPEVFVLNVLGWQQEFVSVAERFTTPGMANMETAKERVATMIAAVESTDGSDVSGMFSSADLAKKHGVDPEALRQKLNRWRVNNFDGYIEAQNRKPNDPKYLYREASVMETINGLK